MKHVKLGDLNVSRIGLGAMGMSAAYAGAAPMTPGPSAPSGGRWSSASPSSTPPRRMVRS
jgi:hypothetical protein